MMHAAGWCIGVVHRGEGKKQIDSCRAERAGQMSRRIVESSRQRLPTAVHLEIGATIVDRHVVQVFALSRSRAERAVPRFVDGEA